MFVHTDAWKRWFGTLFHHNSCLVLSIKKGQTVQITLLGKKKKKEKKSLQDVLITCLSGTVFLKMNALWQWITPAESEMQKSSLFLILCHCCSHPALWQLFTALLSILFWLSFVIPKQSSVLKSQNKGRPCFVFLGKESQRNGTAQRSCSFPETTHSKNSLISSCLTFNWQPAVQSLKPTV